jgi:cell division transport system permease protein
MTTVLYFIQEATAYLRGDRVTLTMTTLTFSFSMLIFGLFLLLYLNASAVLEGLRSEIRILLYLKEGVSEAGVKSLGEKVGAEPGISEIRYVSKDQAMADFKKSMEGSELLLKGLGENPLPASFELTVDPVYRSSESMAALVEKLKGISGVDQIQYGKEWVENIEKWLWLFRMVAWGVGGLLAFTVTAIVANTIKLTVSLRKNEVEILRLMGATKGFVCVPFILEGAFVGLLASGIALGILAALFNLGRRNFLVPGSSFAMTDIFSFLPLPWALGFLFMGFFLGSLGSYWPFRRWS